MLTVQAKYLQFVDFSFIKSWSSYSLLGKNLIYTQKYPFVAIGDFLKRNKTPITIENDILYKRATIRINGKGISLRDEVLGKSIGTKSQFLIHEKQFLLSKIDARNGAFGVVPSELHNGIITGNFWTFDVDYNLVNPYYLTLLTGTKEFQKLCQTASVGTTNRNYLQEELFLNFEIPLPSLEEQEALVNAFNIKKDNAEKLFIEGDNLEAEVEKYFFEKLAIKRMGKKDPTNSFMVIDFNAIVRWGVEYNSNTNSGQSLISEKYDNQLLKSVITIGPKTQLPKNDNISFVPMESVSDDYGEIIEKKHISAKDSKGYTKIKEGDIIWARITPCMQNGKSAIARDLINGFGCGSTEFHVLRNEEESQNRKVTVEYIYHILRLPTVRQNAMKHFTGSAGQQRVPKSYLENLKIPIPPIYVQKELTQYLESIKKQVRAKRIDSVLLKQEAQKEFENAIFGK